MENPRIGLLGLYLELYDRVLPDARTRMEGFYAQIASELAKRGLDVVIGPVCRLKDEFSDAVRSFEEAEADAIVTLHLAYSPSLESADVLAETHLPVIVLDTTPAYSYGPDQNPDELLYNHGIHGVQDLCNVLNRKRKPFQIAAGHWEKSDVLDRVKQWADAAQLVTRMRKSRVGIIGQPFEGMGDFQVSRDVLTESLGIKVIQADFKALAGLIPDEDDISVTNEMAEDRERFITDGLEEASHRASVRASLAVREWIKQEELTAVTMNFEHITRQTGLPTVPFLEVSKAMARGTGYAGEGDVLTAAFVGALVSAMPQTTFTEMFCPDWERDAVYLSHMGEMNPDLVSGKARLITKDMPWLDADPPVITTGRFRPGEATFVNLAPCPDDTFTLVAAEVEMLDAPDGDRMEDSIRGWFRTGLPLPDFLEVYSRAGGTHHAALIYGHVADRLERMAVLMDWNVMILG